VARPIRVEFPGALYHVIVRGNERKEIFRDDSDRREYLRRLAHYREKFGFRLLAYCLMGNHAHLAVEIGKFPLSQIMAGLQSAYTQYFNRRHRRVGHLFQGRYKAFVVEKDIYALALIRYIHENPVKARLALRPEEYRWSSDRDYRRGQGPEWLDVSTILAMLGSRRPAAIRGYRRLMREEVEEPYEEAVSWGQLVKGDEAFAGRILEAAGETPVTRPGLTVETVSRLVASLEGIALERLRGTSRARRESRSRIIAAWVGREAGRISLACTARYFFRDTSTLAKGVARLEHEIAEDPSLRKRLDKLRRRLVGREPHNATIQD
jgi:REP element-mobilizing transposase RayT